MDGGTGIRVAIEGCGHGELDKIYETIAEMEKAQGFRIDLLICCGDFQAVRNYDDLETMSCPPKYRHLNTFYKYYSVGGNHEAANYLWELYHGGWVAPNIYFLGYAGVVRLGNLRIGGISGIENEHHFKLGHYEAPPYNAKSIKSAYHIRELEFMRLMQVREPLDIFLSHDWPRGIYNHGNKAELLRRKPFFRKEVEQSILGSFVGQQLMAALQPKYWFSAHLHVKHAALVSHPPDPGQTVGRVTKFLALDKCLPGRDFLQMVYFPDAMGGKPLQLEYDPEWLAIVRCTHDQLTTSYRAPPFVPPTPDQIDEHRRFTEGLLSDHGPKIPVRLQPLPCLKKRDLSFRLDLDFPELNTSDLRCAKDNFRPTVPPMPSGAPAERGRMPTKAWHNPQTQQFLEKLGLSYNLSTATQPPRAFHAVANPEEINLEDMPDHVENPEEINLDNDGDDGDDDDGMAPIERPGGMFDAVEIHGSAVVGKHEL